MHTEPYPKYILRNIVISGTSVAGGGNLPSGGTTGQYLRKISGTDYDTEWGTLTVANITDLTATSAELNYVDGVTSNVQTQLNAKLGTTLTSAYIYVGNGSNVATGVAVTGDVTISNAGVTAIGSGVIVNADINASAAIAQSKMAALTASRAMVTDASGFATASAATSTEVGYLSGVTSAIQTQLNAKLTSTLTSAYVFVGNGSNVATGVAISGDITISNAGVVAIAGGVIVNADVNASAAIAVSKLAAVTASRALVSDGSGFMSASSVTATELGYVSGVTAAIQTQLDNEIATKTVNAIVKAPTVAEDGYAITWDNGAGEYTLSDPVIQGIPTGGTARQFLGKNSGTNYDASWLGLVTTDITDITSTAAELNILDGATLTTTELNYVDGVTSNIQTQLDAKQSSSLAQNAMWIGNASNIATQLSPGTSGYILTSVGGVPQWQAPSGTLSGLTSTRIPYAASATSLTDSATLTWDNTNKAVSINGMRVWTDHTTNGKDNTFVGYNTGNYSVTGIDNCGFGPGALLGITSGDGNIGIGNLCGSSITNGSGNINIGFLTGTSIISGTGNVILGYTAGDLVTGDYNIILGFDSGDALTSGSSNVIIGASIDAQSATASNQLTIQNAIFGSSNSGTGTTVSTGNLGFFATAWGTSAAKVISVGTGTAPSTSPADSFQFYSADIAAGNAAPHFRSEAGHIVKLYTTNSGSAYSITNGTTDRTYDANATSTDELADVLYTLIEDLKLSGIIA